VILSPNTRWAALAELRSLGHYARVTGQDLVELIDVPPHIRADMERIMRDEPEHARIYERALAIRDFMLEHVEWNGVR
jgi:hypothetical protein